MPHPVGSQPVPPHWVVLYEFPALSNTGRYRDAVIGVIEPQPISTGVGIMNVDAFRLDPIFAPGREWGNQREVRVFGIHARWVFLYCVLAEAKLMGDFAIAEAVGDQGDDLLLVGVSNLFPWAFTTRSDGNLVRASMRS